MERVDEAHRASRAHLDGLHELDPGDDADLGDELLGGARHPEVVLVHGVGHRRRHRRRRRTEPDAGQGERGNDPEVALARCHLGEPRHRDGDRHGTEDAGGALPDPQRHIAPERGGDGEGERARDRQQTDPRLAVAERGCEEEGRDDEAPHVGEVREELGSDRRDEVATPEVVDAQQRRRAPGLPAEERHQQDR